MAIDLEVTGYGTIKGEEFKETTINNFLKKLTKRTDSWSITHFKDNSIKASCEVKVFKIEDNNYNIVKEEYDSENHKTIYKEYNLNIDQHNEYFPLLKSKLDELVDNTKKNKNISEKVNNCENEKINLSDLNKDEIKEYLSLIKKSRGECKQKIAQLSIAPAIVNGFLLLPMIPLAIEFGIAVVIVTTIFLLPITNLMIELFQVYSTMAKWFHKLKVYKIKEENVKEKLKKLDELNKKEEIKELEKEEEKEITEKIDAYNETIISYMNSIMNDARKINKKDSYIILNELKNILNEYTTKAKEFKEPSGLSINSDKSSIIYPTIEKLVAIEMMISDIKKKEDENKNMEDESSILSKQLDEYIELASPEVLEQSSDIVVKNKTIATNM